MLIVLKSKYDKVLSELDEVKRQVSSKRLDNLKLREDNAELSEALSEYKKELPYKICVYQEMEGRINDYKVEASKKQKELDDCIKVIDVLQKSAKNQDSRILEFQRFVDTLNLMLSEEHTKNELLVKQHKKEVSALKKQIKLLDKIEKQKTLTTKQQ